jgi:manganese efflux pump family protein
MDLITIAAIALGLSFDTFAVSLSCGVIESKISFRNAMRIAFILALFQGGLTSPWLFSRLNCKWLHREI